jgi:hypothetical protein
MTDVEDYYPQEKLYDFYMERLYCDFTIVCSDGVELPVHRIILAKESSVFKAMFSADMIESKTNARATCTKLTKLPFLIFFNAFFYKIK